MSRELFRAEAIHARRRQMLGRIILAQPLRLWSAGIFFSVASFAVVLFLCLGTYARRSTVTGHLVPTKGLAVITAPSTGVISQIKIKEGDNAARGEIIGVVISQRATVAEGDAQAALERGIEERRGGLISINSAQVSQLHAQAVGLEEQLINAKRELHQIDDEIATRQEQSRIASETLGKLKQLEESRYISILQIKQQESIALDYLAQIQVLRRQATAARQNIAQINQALNQIPGQERAAEGAFRRDLAQLAQERIETEARGALVISAPISGLIAAQLVKTGQSVQAGQPILTMLPSASLLEAEIFAPSRAIGFIEVGDRVVLRYSAYPFQKFGHQLGTVSSISRSPVNSEVSGVSKIDQSNDPVYRITVALKKQSITIYNREEKLRPGMILDADILGERRGLLEWLFEPLYSLKGRVGS